MNIILYGKGKLGQRAYDYLANAEGIMLIGLCADSISESDTTLELADSKYNPFSVPVFSLDEAGKAYKNKEADAMILATDNEVISFVSRRILENGIYDIALLPAYYEDELYDIDDNSFEWIEITKPRLDYIEYHISFHCNLNCKGCSHFSNLIREPRFGDYDQFVNDISRLRDLFWGISKIRLMGGEPVLNKQLPDFVYAARQAFPDADIRIVSNGLMIREDQKELFKAMRECAVFFDISTYPPTSHLLSRLNEICGKEHVRLTVTPPVNEFSASLDLTGTSDPAVSFDTCPARHCVYLCNGKISTCIMPQIIDVYNKEYGTDIKAGESDVIDLYEEGLKGIDLIERLKKPMEICRYCSSRRRVFEWKPGNDPQMDDWVADK